MQPLTSLKSIDDERFFIFKHSSSCPISAMVYKTIENLEPELELPVYLLVVQRNRPISNLVERQFRVTHESPQLLLIEGDRAVWNASHMAITKSDILAALK